VQLVGTLGFVVSAMRINTLLGLGQCLVVVKQGNASAAVAVSAIAQTLN
jgi:hypothetical protein